MYWKVTAALILLIFSLWMRWRKKKINIFRDLEIPGPQPNIIFGNMWEIYQKGPLKCHEEWIKQYGKICGYFLGMKPILLIADSETLKQVEIKDFQSFTDRPSDLLRLKDEESEEFNHLIRLRGQKWKETRCLLSSAFTSGKLKQMGNTMSDAIDLTMDIVDEKAANGKEFDMYSIWQGLTADVIGRTAFGIDASVQRNQDHVLLRSARVMFSHVYIQSIIFLFGLSFKEFGGFFDLLRSVGMRYRNKMEDPVRKLLNGVEEVIANRRGTNTKRPDLLQSLIDVQKTDAVKNINIDKLTALADDSSDETEGLTTVAETKKSGFLSNEEVKANAFMMYLAGYETTSTALAYTTYALVKHQQIQETLRNEVRRLYEKEGELSSTSIQRLPYMDQVFSESLRKYPPIYLFVNRQSVKETTVGGYTIPKGMIVQAPVYWLHHDSEYWDHPEAFDPSRFEKDNEAKSKLMWQPFGAGPRNCIGMRFALLEAKLAIAKLLLKYRLEPSESTDKIDICIRMGAAILSPLNGVFLKAIPLKT